MVNLAQSSQAAAQRTDFKNGNCSAASMKATPRRDLLRASYPGKLVKIDRLPALRLPNGAPGKTDCVDPAAVILRAFFKRAGTRSSANPDVRFQIQNRRNSTLRIEPFGRAETKDSFK
jgi:hypothetical protein